MGLTNTIRGWSAALDAYARAEYRAQNFGSIWKDALSADSRAYTGRTVTEENAQSVVAVFAAIGIISDGLAGLPFVVYRRDGAEKGDRATDHPLYRVLHDEFNPGMDAMVGRELLTSHLCAYGNAYAEVIRDSFGRVEALFPLIPTRMTVDANRDGTRIFRYRVDDANVVELDPMRVLHLRLRGDRLVGWSPIRTARESIGLAMAAEEFAARFYNNNAQPGIVLKHPGRLSKDAHAALKTSWEESHKGLSNAHRAAILEEGMTVEKLGIPPEDAQFLETRQFQVAEIARLYRVPPHLIGDVERSTSWGTGIEQQQIAFQQFTLRAYAKRWEQAVALQLMLPRERDQYLAEHLLDDLLRADTTARVSAYASAITNGWMSRNEVRRRENLPPVDGLDDFLIPVSSAQPQEPEEEPEEAPEPRMSINVTPTTINVPAETAQLRAMTEAVRALGKQPPAVVDVHVEAPPAAEVHVDAPVTVNVPEQRQEAPIVNVSTPPAEVRVETPAVQDIRIVKMPTKRIRVKRDDDGRIAEVEG